jgi:diacylglycerol kinase (ATP)
MRESSVFVVFNPAAGRGRGARRIEPLLALLRRHLPSFDHAFTGRPGEEAALAENAIGQGYQTIVAVGGDGTWSSVADCIVRSGKAGVRLALLAGGTGNDFGKTFGITFERSEEVVRAIAEGRTRRIDVGRVGTRHFLNVVGLGFDIAVILDAARFPILKGDALYRFCALRQLFRFPGIALEITGEFSPPLHGDHLMVVVANARYFGGSFLIAPNADLADGKLDVVAIRNAGPRGRMRLFRKVARGAHEREPEVGIVRSRRVEILLSHPDSFEIDGEVFESGGRKIEIETVPRALDLVVPPNGGAPS